MYSRVCILRARVLHMCLFPLPNPSTESIAYRKGVTEFDCGACPECMQKRSNTWALRAFYEAKAHVHNCMVTLTYDEFLRDDCGNIIGEKPVDSSLHVVKRDVQLFLKRLRKWYSTISDEKIKYIACAEYGLRTHRAHYHLVLFGVKFSDAAFYKKSGRGNPIYMSKKLTDLWSHGICTIDSVRVTPAIAKYCTKYVAKSRSDDTFMLFSQSIGLDGLMRDFNGRSYWIDGREYTVPRKVWETYIMRKYAKYPSLARGMSSRYVNRTYETLKDGSFYRANRARRRYRQVRDMDSLYRSYLTYWQRKGECFDRNKLDARTRILQLPESKYHSYKVAALEVMDKYRVKGIPYPAPLSNCVSAYGWYVYEREKKLEDHFRMVARYMSSLARPSRHNRASDTPQKIYKKFLRHLRHIDKKNHPKVLTQLSFDDIMKKNL